MTENSGKDSTKVGDNYMMTEASSSNQTSTINTIRDVTEVVCSIEEKLYQTNPIPSKCSIFRVPDKIRMHNENDFEPELVSVGPFHHGKEKLLPMQEIKLWYLHCLLNRVPTNEITLKCFVEAIEKIEQECRACYAGEIGFVKKEFIEMMVIDGCFIIEFFRKYSSLVHREEEDPVFNSSLWTCQIKNDLFLLENQLPWRVLECLFSMTRSNDQEMSLPDLILSDPTGLKDPHGNLQNRHLLVGLQDPHGILQNRHLLGCYRNNFVGSFDRGINHSKWERPISGTIPSVTELILTGVKIKIGDKNCMLNVTFENGAMTIPPIRIAEDTKSFFRNAVALEQCESTQDHKVNSYALLLHALIRTSHDVDILEKRGILNGFMRTEDTLTFFDRLGTDAAYANFHYSQLYCDVQAYCRTHWRVFKTTLKRDYLSKPDVMLSGYFALIGLVLAFSQAFIGAASYGNKKS